MSLDELVRISRKVGGDSEWVLAGGGNTSFKDEATLWVKASGYPLATIGEDGFARMDRAALGRIWNAVYPQAVAEREADALRDLMAARVAGEEKRPSVETLMHELFPYRLVVHTHPALVNGLTCSADGRSQTARLFGTDALWMDAIEPGYVLAAEMRRAAEEYARRHGRFPRIVLLQNHGLVVAADSAGEIAALNEQVRSTIGSRLHRVPDLRPAAEDVELRDAWHAVVGAALAGEGAGPVEMVFAANHELDRLLSSRERFRAVESAFTPDHIVYAGSRALLIDGDPRGGEASLRVHVRAYGDAHGGVPRIVCVAGLGAFAAAESEGAAGTAMALFIDEVKIAAYAESFGGSRPLDDHLVRFIESWEVERYRKQVSGGGAA